MYCVMLEFPAYGVLMIRPQVYLLNRRPNYIILNCFHCFEYLPDLNNRLLNERPN